MMEVGSTMEARHRRMKLRRLIASKNSLQHDLEENSVDNDDDHSCFSSSSEVVTTVSDPTTMNKKQKTLLETPSTNADLDLSMYRGIKKQARYEPAIPISSKAELAVWRKEARRIRNRESAAASRNKTRERIDELEGELGTMKNQYATALRRIVELEAALLQNSKMELEASLNGSPPIDTPTNQVSPTLSSSKPVLLPTELNIATPDANTEAAELLLWSPDHQCAAEALAKSLSYDITTYEDSTVIPNYVAPEQAPTQQKSLHQSPSTTIVSGITTNSSSSAPTPNGSSALCTIHQNIKISRPTAVCVVPI